MATPFVVGVMVAGMAYTGRFIVRAVQRARNSQSIFEVSKKSFNMETVEEGFESKMTPDEAYSILGIDKNATKEEIKIRHKHLMIKNHPDKGGSSYLATKINEAKTILSNNY
ncbi:hypothetical protein DICPUDRAFT_40098 [Dictyostelium purpureum]|uniref:J domain-containing protein n=1 Tax=Dictyostelium purpureum TaxID=5786 RepID=F0ZXI2_DICPU|nr:uncharacterized protein DICPUDRAFT_40098 [Dictyostelium purpureum]EGC31346.1 hypothetical protein DICPUDRAFT_40098 [Dictyostelium purpureum]|eukprot:XP_003292122.1 hypothetical protein DICPUDRAFT_40098 [Dictyostelium purpureum]